MSSRGKLHPDPEFDRIEAIFVTLTNDVPVDSAIPESMTVVILIDDVSPAANGNKNIFCRTGVVNVELTVVENELSLFREVFKLIRSSDPDILLGYEVMIFCR